jgi:hypothetical protein
VLVAGQLVGHGLLIGTAPAQQPELWRYLPHQPLEWLALALPAGAWLRARASAPPHRREPALVAPLTLAVLTASGIIETYLVPLR